ncbi:hypothetical protein MMC13_001693 [Lambiella insularis]|nr:hypothetical protein [Lambiella insularis]
MVKPKIILAINAGSSSVKVSVYKSIDSGQPPSQLAEIQISGLTAPPATLDYKRESKSICKGQETQGVNSQETAFENILDHLTQDHDLPDIADRNTITHACHRVVHGGDAPAPHVIDPPTYHRLEELMDLAPLHNAGALSIVKACHKALPKATNIAYFDSSFHQTMSPATRTYPIDPKVAKRNGLRKYGFHGLSYAFITRSVAEHLKKDSSETSIIALHLGSGASACAIKNGKSLDTSMGLTPLDGLPGATRSGGIDPSLIFHFTHDAGRPSPSSSKDMHISTAEEILNKKSGWKALTGTTDFGKISHSEAPECKLAFDIFVDRILGFIGSYYVKLEGQVDALVFAGGIGEKGASLRAAIAKKCECLGFELDNEKNSKSIEHIVQDIGKKSTKHRTLVCQTDEQQLAKEMAQPYNSQLDAFALYHKIQEPEETSWALGGPALPALGHAIAGSTGAAVSNVITYPLDLIITRLQIQSQLRKKSSEPHTDEYASLSDAASKIYTQEGGIAGLYTGVLQDTSKTVADAFLFFLAYNFLRQSRLRSAKYSTHHLPALDELSVGFLAGAFSKLLTTPIANIVTRKQTASMLAARDTDNSSKKSATVSSIAAQIRSEKGLRGFWSGYSASLVLTLNPSLTFFLFETFKRALLPRAQQQNPLPASTFFLAAISKAIASTITYPFSLAKARAQVSSKSVDDNYDEVKETFEKASSGTTDGTRPGRIAFRRTVFSTIVHIAQTEGLLALYEGLGGEVMKGFFSHGITMLLKDRVHQLIIRLYYALLNALNRSPSSQDLYQTTKSQASDSLDSFKAGVDSLQQRTQSLAQQGAAQVSSAYNSAKAAAQGAGTSVQNSITSSASQTSDAATGAYNEALTTSRTAVTNTTESSKAAAASTKASLTSTTTAGINKSSAIASDTYNAARNASAPAMDSLSQAASHASDASSAASSKALDAARGVADHASRTAEPVAEYVGRKTEEAGGAMRPSKGAGDEGE